MDPETAELASAAATTMVNLLTTEAWETVRDKIVALWRRFRPDQADAVASELAQGHAELTSAGAAADDAGAAGLALSRYWESRLLRLLAENAAAVPELRRAVAGLSGRPESAVIRQRADASGGSSVIQVAGDAWIGNVPRPSR
jgi:hypothetical protein